MLTLASILLNLKWQVIKLREENVSMSPQFCPLYQLCWLHWWILCEQRQQKQHFEVSCWICVRNKWQIYEASLYKRLAREAIIESMCVMFFKLNAGGIIFRREFQGCQSWPTFKYTACQLQKATCVDTHFWPTKRFSTQTIIASAFVCPAVERWKTVWK